MHSKFRKQVKKRKDLWCIRGLLGVAELRARHTIIFCKNSIVRCVIFFYNFLLFDIFYCMHFVPSEIFLCNKNALVFFPIKISKDFFCRKERSCSPLSVIWNSRDQIRSSKYLKFKQSGEEGKIQINECLIKSIRVYKYYMIFIFKCSG